MPESKIELDPCPHCKGTDIRYSTKAAHKLGELQYRASHYCSKCHAYGPRVLSQNMNQMDYKTRRDVEKDKVLEQMSADAWNKRV